ncbi:hypothetical protein BK726_08655 [Bacillus thuringiensis serovar londrina]|uniref:hypothetical protein n=1 Tax=Bacillus thuringiensis TaxID=1428 RepID=UPI000B4397AE|nr:hypothetical protein [Bacillus thuringiensis]OTX93006.1 hypothetical protein BK726_08655 [Bacillus thuringiensis serovar londrina]
MGNFKRGLLVSLSLVVSIPTFATNAFAEETYVENDKTITVFTEPEELESFKADFGEVENAELTSVTMVRSNEDVVEGIIDDFSVMPAGVAAAPSFFSIKNVRKTKGCGSTEIRRSTYFHPGSTMTVTQGLSATVSADLGISLTKSYTVSDAQQIVVPKGKRKTVKAFSELDIWNYNVYLGPVKRGTGSATKPVGVFFAEYLQ